MVNALLRPIVFAALQLPAFADASGQGAVFLSLDDDAQRSRAMMTPRGQVEDEAFIVAMRDSAVSSELLPVEDPGPEIFMARADVDRPNPQSAFLH